VHKFKQSLFALAGLLLVLGVIAALNPSTSLGRQGQPAGRPPSDVNVVNTPTVNVAGTPSVNVANTPTVNVASLPAVQVEGTPSVNVTNVVPTYPGVPPNAFSVYADNLSGTRFPIRPPRPEGTGFAVTSLLVTNYGPNSISASLIGSWGTTSDCRNYAVINNDDKPKLVAGPDVRMPPSQTVQVTFPQPAILSAKPGRTSCLVVEVGNADDYRVNIYVTGYELPPAAQPQQ
jgi:hypothetical protein